MLSVKFKILGYICLAIGLLVIILATIFKIPHVFILGVLFLIEAFILLYGDYDTMAHFRFLFGVAPSNKFVKINTLIPAIFFGIFIIFLLCDLIYAFINHISLPMGKL